MTNHNTCSSSNNSREQLLRSINEVSFAVNDIHLYLDTHPCDEKAMEYYRKMAEKRNEMMKEYAKMYGPLTVDDAVYSDSSTWQWMEQPFPWEQEGGRR